MNYVACVSIVAVLVGAGSLWAVAPATAPANDAAVAYRFEPGMELVYEGAGETNGSYHMKTTSKQMLWVLGRNDDGTARVLLRSEASMQFNDQKPDTSTSFLVANVAPDGRATDVRSSEPFAPAALPLPILPPGDGSTVDQAGAFGAVTHYRRDPASPAGQLLVVGEQTSPLDPIYGLSHHATHTIDLARGLPVRVESRIEQTYGAKSTGMDVAELKSTERRDPAFIRALDEQSRAYLDANAAYQQVAEDDNAAPAALDAARTSLASAAGRVTEPMFKEKLEATLAEHDGLVKQRAASAAEQAKLLGQPAAEWTLNDLAGKSHKLADYRGKVVVLDFWYRGCGWCIRAMPDMNRVVEDFKDQPVAILGINSDQRTEDAQFVADKMHLAYPTLLGPGTEAQPSVAGRYGVHAFPTLLLIDKAGVVRDVHVGYSPTLRQDLGAKIQKLLR